MSLYSEKIEALIDAALADGVLTEKEKQVLFKRAQAEGIDLDEFEMVLDARLVELQKKVKEDAKKAAPKSDKFGDVRKCPACGALVQALAIFCPECGYEFSGVNASPSVQLLAKEISEIKKAASARKNELVKSRKYSAKKQNGEISSSQEKALNNLDEDAEGQIDSLIANFPVPNTKSDLFDLIMYLKAQGYNEKYNECMNRASILFPNDSLYIKLKESEKTDKEKEQASEKRLDRQADYGIISLFGTPVLIICLWIAEWSFLGIGWVWKLIIALLICPILAILIMKIFKKLYVK